MSRHVPAVLSNFIFTARHSQILIGVRALTGGADTNDESETSGLISDIAKCATPRPLVMRICYDLESKKRKEVKAN